MVMPTRHKHDLRHKHATLLLLAGVPVNVVSKRLGHANATVTLSVYAYVLPGNQREVADTFARLIGGSGA
jgi:integrase